MARLDSRSPWLPILPEDSKPLLCLTGPRSLREEEEKGGSRKKRRKGRNIIQVRK